jgi:hypothetical protein
MKKLSFRPSPAMVVACVALFVALGGTGVAATYVVSSNSQVGPNTISGHKPPSGDHANIIGGSLNATDLANGAATLSKLAPNSVNGGKVVNGSLTAADTDTSSIQRRLDGGCASGQAIESVGQTGASTCSAVGFTQVTQRSASGQGGAEASCQAGETLVGGGGATIPGDSLQISQPSSGGPEPGWTVTPNNDLATATAIALCAK